MFLRVCTLAFIMKKEEAEGEKTIDGEKNQMRC